MSYFLEVGLGRDKARSEYEHQKMVKKYHDESLEYMKLVQLKVLQELSSNEEELVKFKRYEDIRFIFLINPNGDLVAATPAGKYPKHTKLVKFLKNSFFEAAPYKAPHKSLEPLFTEVAGHKGLALTAEFFFVDLHQCVQEVESLIETKFQKTVSKWYKTQSAKSFNNKLNYHQVVNFTIDKNGNPANLKLKLHDVDPSYNNFVVSTIKNSAPFNSDFKNSNLCFTNENIEIAFEFLYDVKNKNEEVTKYMEQLHGIIEQNWYKKKNKLGTLHRIQKYDIKASFELDRDAKITKIQLLKSSDSSTANQLALEVIKDSVYTPQNNEALLNQLFAEGPLKLEYHFKNHTLKSYKHGKAYSYKALGKNLLRYGADFLRL